MNLKPQFIPMTEEELPRLSLDELNAWIAYSKERLDGAPTKLGRKVWFEKLRWLEGFREKAHGVAAPKRSLRARSAD